MRRYSLLFFHRVSFFKMSTSLLCEAAFSGLFGLCIVHASFTRSLQSLTVALLFGISVEYLVYVSIELIEPRLWTRNSEPPSGWQRATLPMCFQKGWGAGTAALARKLKERAGRAHTQ